MSELALRSFSEGRANVAQGQSGRFISVKSLVRIQPLAQGFGRRVSLRSWERRLLVELACLTGVGGSPPLVHFEKLSTSTFMWFVYVLLCSDNSLYTGSSNNPQARFEDHKNGKGGRYTRSHKPKKLIYTEELESKSAALKREIEIKSWTRDEKIKTLSLKI